MKVYGNLLLLALLILSVGLVYRCRSVCPASNNSAPSCYFDQYSNRISIHPGLNRALCLDLSYMQPISQQSIAVFSSCDSFGDGDNYRDGYACRYSTERMLPRSNNCTKSSIIVECIDENTLPSGQAVLPIYMEATDFEKAQALQCIAFIDVSWTQTGVLWVEYTTLNIDTAWPYPALELQIFLCIANLCVRK